jgi:hypothetical protein
VLKRGVRVLVSSGQGTVAVRSLTQKTKEQRDEHAHQDKTRNHPGLAPAQGCNGQRQRQRQERLADCKAKARQRIGSAAEAVKPARHGCHSDVREHALAKEAQHRERHHKERHVADLRHEKSSQGQASHHGNGQAAQPDPVREHTREDQPRGTCQRGNRVKPAKGAVGQAELGA